MLAARSVKRTSKLIIYPTLSLVRAVHRPSETNTVGASGVGAQYKFGSWGVRAEYERFNAAGRNPGLLSAGITWTFF
jgi:hypothetical protein